MLDLSYKCLTSERARAALTDRISASTEFAKSLRRPETTGVEDSEELDEDDQGDEVVYDEIDSSKLIDEEVGALILQNPRNITMDKPDSDGDDVQIVGTNVERYTGYEFSSRGATNLWMEWDAQM